jgi:hypothetical protein
MFKKLEPNEYEILLIFGLFDTKWATFVLIIDFRIAICCSHRHCKFSYHPLATHCFHCPKSCEMCYSDDDKENRSSNMRRRVVWYNVTKTEVMTICTICVIEWTNRNCMLRIFNWTLRSNNHFAVLNYVEILTKGETELKSV